jgi:putative hydrolase of the HAD superfamily
MPRPQTLFFDMDDTLIDSLGASQASWKSIGTLFASRAGVEADAFRDALLAEAREFWKDEAKVGHWRIDLTGARVMYTRTALERQGWDSALAEEIASHYEDVHMSSLIVFPDTLRMIEQLRGQGFRLGLITNGPQALQRRKIAKFGFADLFDVIVIEGEFGRGKPDRAVFEHALAATGTNPESAWHTGDNQYADIGGAQSAGIRGVWIHRERLELQPEHPAPDHIIGHLDELFASLDA